MPADAETVAIVRKNVVVLWSAPGARGSSKGSRKKAAPKISTIDDLSGHQVGIIGRTKANVALLQVILTESGIDVYKRQAFVGQHLQCLGFKDVFCCLCHRVELADIAAVVHHLAGDNKLVLVVDDGLHIVTRNTLTALDQKPGVRIGQRHLRLAARFQPSQVGIGARALRHQRRYFGADIATISSAAPVRTVGAILPRFVGFRCIIVFNRHAVSLNLQVQPGDLFGEPLARKDARLAGIAMKEGAIDRNNGPADKAKFANQQHEAAVHRLQRRPVLLAEVGDCSIARLQVPQQPEDVYKRQTKRPPGRALGEG